jgi:bifunctional non-homologous end joining protein LigD
VGLVAFVQTSGSRGLHVHVPLRRGPDFDAVRQVASGVAEVLAGRHPDALTTAARKAQRGERIYLDVQRNAWAQTAVPPYAVRARPGAPVATPLEWDELGDGDLSPVRWTMQNLFRRLGQRDDPWRDMARRARDLDGPRERVEELLRQVRSSR